MKVMITFKRGIENIATVIGREMSIEKVDQEKVIEVEQYLERMTGWRVHIDELHGRK